MSLAVCFRIRPDVLFIDAAKTATSVRTGFHERNIRRSNLRGDCFNPLACHRAQNCNLSANWVERGPPIWYRGLRLPFWPPLPRELFSIRVAGRLETRSSTRPHLRDDLPHLKKLGLIESADTGEELCGFLPQYQSPKRVSQIRRNKQSHKAE